MHDTVKGKLVMLQCIVNQNIFIVQIIKNVNTQVVS